MKLSVVIPCLNEESSIGHQLAAIARQQWDQPWEVVVADNGSTDGTRAVVFGFSDRIPNLRVVDASDRAGQPHALNVGAAEAAGGSVAFCDADDEVGDGWLAAMGAALETHLFVAGSFEMKKLNPHGLMNRHPQENGIGNLRNPPYLRHAGSGNMGIRRSLFRAVGGFDETMPYLFDTDFCFKVQLSGVNLELAPGAVLHVRRPERFGDIFRKAGNYANYHAFLYKRYRQLGMPRIFFWQGVRSWKNLIRRATRIRNRQSLARWLWGFGWRVGWFRGCLRHKVPGVWLGP